MRRAISLLLCFAVPCFAQEPGDAGTLIVEIDAGTPFVYGDSPKQKVVVLTADEAAITAKRILSCEAERDEFRKGPIVTPWVVVAIALGSALVTGVAVVGAYELTRKP
jgi:hypothetical protein